MIFRVNDLFISLWRSFHAAPRHYCDRFIPWRYRAGDTACPQAFPRSAGCSFYRSPYSIGRSKYLVDILARNTSLTVIPAGHCEEIKRNTIHIAPPNFHLLVNSTHTYLSDGPRENLCRPAIDPLLRSAAMAYGPRVIGIILSGELYDATAGLHTIKKCGGTAIVQDPATAAAPSMPESAQENVAVDYALPASDIGSLVNNLVMETVPADFQCPDEAKRELAFLTGTSEGIHLMEGNNSLIPVGCPACGGPLWELEGKFARYRCHIGHAFTGRSVVQGLKEGEEHALYAALRAMEERSRGCSRSSLKRAIGSFMKNGCGRPKTIRSSCGACCASGRATSGSADACRHAASTRQGTNRCSGVPRKSRLLFLVSRLTFIP